jgi:ribonucleoside-triphosphate reductase
MQVIKRNGEIVPYDFGKIEKAVTSAFKAVTKEDLTSEFYNFLDDVQLTVEECFSETDTVDVEIIQDVIEHELMSFGYFEVAKAYILYRDKHEESRFVRERLDYMDNYANSKDNAATSSETDANANVTQKNVANLEGEVYKTQNRIIQRQRMKDILNKIYPEVAKQYEEDLNHHIIYTHDEASTPVLKQYCMAVSLFPLLTEGVGNIDGVTPGPPNDLQSFSGQITNLAFLLSSQCKGAVAFGEYFIALNYYVRMEFGNDWYEHLNDLVTSPACKIQRSVGDSIIKAFKQFV